MKIEGKFLSFDTELPGTFYHIFPKDCEIDIPEKVPVIWNFRSYEPNSVIGSGEVVRKDDGLYLIADIKDIPKEIKGLGGFYNKLEFRKTEESVHIIEKASLGYVSVLEKPINKEFRFKVVGGR